MRKNLLVLLSAIGVLSLAACGDKKVSQSEAPASNTISESNETPVVESSSKQDQVSESSSPSIDESSPDVESPSESESPSIDESSPDVESPSESESSEPVVEHTHEFDDNGICVCGETEPGRYPVDIDGKIDDEKWQDVEGIEMFGDELNPAGFGIKAFVDENYVYGYTKAVTTQQAVLTMEIVHNSGKTFNIDYDADNDVYTARASEEGTLLTFKVSRELVDDLYVTTYEYILNKEILLGGQDKVRAGFDIFVPESSVCSFSAEQPNYWTLYGLNAWSVPNYLVISEDGIEHAHMYGTDDKCIICGEEKPADLYAITLDGKADEWDKKILNNGVRSVDGDGREFSVSAFTDEKYVYVYGKVTHFCEHLTTFEVLALNGGWKELYLINSGELYNSNSPYIVDFKVVEEFNEETLLNESNIEMVIDKSAVKQQDGQVKLGFSSNLGNEESEGLGFSASQAAWWTINKYNSWASDKHFVVSEEGIAHTHDYNEDNICKLCGHEKGAITVDGDLTDWDADILAMTIKASDANATLSVAGFEKDDKIYVAVTGEYADDIFQIEIVRTWLETSQNHWVRVRQDGVVYADGSQDYKDGIQVIDYAIKKTQVDNKTISTYEIVLNKEEGVKYGFGANLDGNAYAFEIPGEWQPAYFFTDKGITDGNEVESDIDGNIDDWSDTVLSNGIQTVGNDNRLFANYAYVDGDDVHFATKVMYVTDAQHQLSVVFNCADEFKLQYTASGLVSKSDNIKEAAWSGYYDEELKVNVVLLEYVIEKSKITDTEGVVKVGFDIWTSDADPLIGSDSNNVWWLIDKKNSWSVPDNFVITADGFVL